MIYAHLPPFDTVAEPTNPNIPYEERTKVYDAALATFGKVAQAIVSIEELSEAQKELCKYLRSNLNEARLAEELADAAICLEQMVRAFGMEEAVGKAMDYKVKRLADRVNHASKGGTANDDR